MPSVYRITRAEYIHDLSGYGAKKYGGRWNRPGVAVLYTSQARSLAMLELIVHFTAKKAFRSLYSFACLSIEESLVSHILDDISSLDIYRTNNEDLWNITDKYFNEKNALCLKVPSVLVPNEYNFLINPIHPGFSSISLTGVEDAIFDRRFLDMMV